MSDTKHTPAQNECGHCGHMSAINSELLDLAEAVVTAFKHNMLPSHVEKHLLDGARAALRKAKTGETS